MEAAEQARRIGLGLQGLEPARPHPRRALERFRFRRNHTKVRALRRASSTGSEEVGIALARDEMQPIPSLVEKIVADHLRERGYLAKEGA